MDYKDDHNDVRKTLDGSQDDSINLDSKGESGTVL